MKPTLKTRCPLLPEEGQSIPARRCLIFHYPPCTPSVKRAKMTSSFELAIDIIWIRENANFCFDELDFLAEKEDRCVDIIRDSASNTLSLERVRRHQVLARIDALICTIRRVYQEKLASAWALHFFVISYVPNMHVIASAQASSVVRAYLQTICCTHAVWHQKDQTMCQLVNHRSMGACDAFGLPRVCVSRFLRTRTWRVHCEFS